MQGPDNGVKDLGLSHISALQQSPVLRWLLHLNMLLSPKHKIVRGPYISLAKTISCVNPKWTSGKAELSDHDSSPGWWEFCCQGRMEGGYRLGIQQGLSPALWNLRYLWDTQKEVSLCYLVPWRENCSWAVVSGVIMYRGSCGVTDMHAVA